MKIESLTYNLITELLEKENNINIDSIYHYTDILFSQKSDLLYKEKDYIDLENSMYITCKLDIKIFKIEDSMIVTFFNSESNFFEILMYEKDNYNNFFTKENFNPDDYDKVTEQINKTIYDLHGNLNVYYDSIMNNESLFHYRETGSLSLYNGVNSSCWKEIIYHTHDNEYSLHIKNEIMNFTVKKEKITWKAQTVISEPEKKIIEDITFGRKYAMEEVEMIFNLGYDLNLENEIFFIKKYNEMNNYFKQKTTIKNGIV